MSQNISEKVQLAVSGAGLQFCRRGAAKSNKTSSLKMAVLLSSVLGMVALGCGGVEPPDPYTPPGGNNGNGNPNNNNNNNNNNGKKVQSPTVDAQSNSACTDSIPLTGRGPIGASILVKGGNGDISTDTHSVTGRFCVDVKLYKNTMNTLKVYALDPQLGLSAPTTISIKQAKCNNPNPNPNPGPTEKSKNMALGGKVKSDEDPKTGQKTAITDGDGTTFAQWSGGWFTAGAGRKVQVDMGKLVEVDKIVIKWRHSANSSTKYFASEYTLWVATGTPGDLSSDNSMWTKVKSITSGNGGTETFNLKSQGLMVQHVGLIMEQDGASYTWTEYFDLAEVEVWKVPKKGTTPTTNPKNKTCSDIDTSS